MWLLLMYEGEILVGGFQKTDQLKKRKYINGNRRGYD